MEVTSDIFILVLLLTIFVYILSILFLILILVMYMKITKELRNINSSISEMKFAEFT